MTYPEFTTERERDLDTFVSNNIIACLSPLFYDFGQHPEAADLDQSGEGVGGAAIKRAVAGPEHDPVVGDQAQAMIEGAKRQVALAGAGRALDQRAAPGSIDTGGDQAGMDDHRRASGRVTTKRAPSTTPSGPVRFSARIEPPWAAAI